MGNYKPRGEEGAPSPRWFLAGPCVHQEAPPAPASLTSSPSTGTSSPVWLSPDAWEECQPPAQLGWVPVPPPAVPPCCVPLAIAGPSPARGHRGPAGSSPTQLPRQPDAPTEAAGRPDLTQEPSPRRQGQRYPTHLLLSTKPVNSNLWG